MAKHKKTPEADILKTKWQSSQIYNDGHYLELKGITSPDVSKAYARAYNKDLKLMRYFATRDRLDKFMAAPVKSSGFKIFTKN